MGKPRDFSTEEELTIDVSGGSQKRHKKHKHKKHKKKKLSRNEDEAKVGPSYTKVLLEPKRIMKIKVKRDDDKSPGKERIGRTIIISGLSSGNLTSPKTTVKKKMPKGNKGNKDSGTSSEEERWLDAIESGKLEEVDDELKKIKPKDPKLMTARQRAMFERKTDTAEQNSSTVEQLMSLPTGYKEKVMTAEAIQKAALKSQKRKQLADEKREKDKKKTMERLLKKQESKASKVIGNKNKLSKRQVPLISYRITLEGSSISLPPNENFPIPTAKEKRVREPIKCIMQSCTNVKRYSCSKTGVPLCSLKCYKANLVAILS